MARKLAAARGYAELGDEVDATLRRYGEAPFATETFWRVRSPGARPALDASPGDPLADRPPFYELHGARRVEVGAYRQIVRARDHVQPIAADLRRWASGAAT